ncbi:hypothetical protein DF41_08705 [Raoultella planticola]|nr:hypothetical protein DF41_08705 [Raoultella planticola]
MITEAAMSGAAAAATDASEGSAWAIASGVATALPAVLDAAAPAIPLPPTSRSARILKNPPIKVVRMPRRMPASPPWSNISRLIPAPRAKAKNGMSSGPPFVRKSRMCTSRLPRIMPTIRGISTATSAMIGMLAIPAAPSAIMVKKGPSFSDKIEIAPTSRSLPNSPTSAA